MKKNILIGILMILTLALSVNANPVLYPIADQDVNEDGTLSFEISTITVPNLGDSTFDFSPSLSWISLTRINNTAATVTLTPDFDDSGIYDIEFSVSDDDSTHADNATITVNNVNRAPTINLPTSRTVVHNFPETLNLDSYTSDPDTGATLTYLVTAENTAEVDCEISASTLTMTADTNFTGTASCTIEVNDGDLTANDTISLRSEAQSPSVSISAIDFGNVNLNTTTDQKSFTVFNNGNLELHNINITWNSAYDKYNFEFTNIPSTLSPSSVSTLNVKMHIPADQSTGHLTVPVMFTCDECDIPFDLKANVLGRLRITDLDVKVDDKTDSNIEDKEDDYKIGERAEPESHVTFHVRVENTFPDDGPDIEDVVVTITIEEIDDDDDDLEEESDSFDLDPDDTKKVSLEFDVPLKVNEEDYTVIIEVEGEDEDGVEHRIVKILLLEVDKESHALMIKKALLSPEMVQCSRTTDLDVTVINIGSREEDEVVINVKSAALGIDRSERDIELSEDPDDDDNEFEKTFELDIKDTVKAGTYSIEVRTYYDEDKLEDLERVNLQVQDCKPVVTPPVEEEEEEEVEVITPPEEEEEVITPPAKEEKKFTETSEYVLILILVNIIVIIVVIALLIALLRK